MSSNDTQAYRTLLNYLHSSSPTLPLDTIASALAYHLAFSSPPTQLAASSVSAPLFLSNSSHEHLNALHNAYRHAIQLHHKPSTSDPQGSSSSFGSFLFRLDPKTQLSQWLTYVVQGLQGGAAVSRLMCCCGLVCGIEDLRASVHADSVVNSRILSKLQGELVLALAEVLDIYYPSTSTTPPSEDSWETEFSERTVKDVLLDALSIASPAVLLLPDVKLSALPLSALGNAYLQIILIAFSNDAGSGSRHLQAMAPMSRLLSRAITLLFQSRTPQTGLELAQTALSLLDDVSQRVASEVPTKSQASPEQRPSLGKTFLFTLLMISDGILSNVIYVNPKIYAAGIAPSPGQLATQTLTTLLHLSHIVAGLGGVSPSSGGGGVKELQRTFHYAVDVLCDPHSASKQNIPQFAAEICSSGPQSAERLSVVLNIIEFLLPTLLDTDEGREVVRTRVWALCLPHIDSPVPSRQIYESAHSVVLSVFAADAQHRLDDVSYNFPFARELVQHYTECLIENSREDRLSAPQLCLAFSSLIRSVNADPYRQDTSGRSARQWSPLQILLDVLPSTTADPERRHMLCLSFLHCIPHLPLPLMLRALDEAERLICEEGDDEKKEQLVQTAFDQILDKVGDQEKEAAVRWWFESLKSGRQAPEERVEPAVHARL